MLDKVNAVKLFFINTLYIKVCYIVIVSIGILEAVRHTEKNFIKQGSSIISLEMEQMIDGP